MKKFLALAAALTMSAAFAATLTDSGTLQWDYSYSTNPDVIENSNYVVAPYEIYSTNASNEIPGLWVVANITANDTKLYITDRITNLYSMSGNNSILELRVGEMKNRYGWVWADDLQAKGELHYGDGSYIEVYNKQINQYNDVVVQKAYYVGEFDAGDNVAIWVTHIGDNKVGFTAGNKEDYNYDAVHNNEQLESREKLNDVWLNPMIQLDYDKNSGSLNTVPFGLLGIHSDTTPVTGQPLPGLALTAALCAGFAALRRRRRR